MHGDGIGSEQAQRAPHHRSVGHGVAWRWNGASSVPWEWRRGSRARVLAASSSRHVNAARVRTVPVWPRVWRGRPGSSGAARSSARGVAWGPRTRVRRWRRPTSGGVAVASSVWQAEWRGRRGRGIGEELKEEGGTGIYMPRPFTPGAIPPPGVKVLYSRCVLPTRSKGISLLLVSNTHREQRLFWRAMKLQPTFTPGCPTRE